MINLAKSKMLISVDAAGDFFFFKKVCFVFKRVSAKCVYNTIIIAQYSDFYLRQHETTNNLSLWYYNPRMRESFFGNIASND